MSKERSNSKNQSSPSDDQQPDQAKTDRVETEETELDFEVGENSLSEKLKKFKRQLAQCEKDKREYLEGWQRAKADFVNARRQDQSEKERHRELLLDEVISQMLPVLDSFDMAFADQKVWQNVDENWRQGVEQIYYQLKSALEGFNLRTIEPQAGEQFDPELHEALEVASVEPAQDGVVIETVQKGYQLKDGERVLRTAKVRVGRHQTPAD